MGLEGFKQINEIFMLSYENICRSSKVTKLYRSSIGSKNNVITLRLSDNRQSCNSLQIISLACFKVTISIS